MNYQEFIQSKIAIAPKSGFNVNPATLPEVLKPHQRDIAAWCIQGGCRAIFAKFGLGKTPMQLSIMKVIAEHEEGRMLIVVTLGVKQEFTRDARNLLDMELDYVRNNEDITKSGRFCITNYERIRDGHIDPNLFIAISLDEASILRGYGTKTFQEFLRLCAMVKYKYVATATPSPNEYKELIHYAGFLGIMDTGEALTRFFQRDSQKASNLTLFPHKEREFWLWVSSWAVFLEKPSDLGYSDDGYDLPPLKVIWHRVERDQSAGLKTDRRTGEHLLMHDAARSLPDASREKRETIPLRVAKMKEIIDAEPDKHFLLWHHLEDERRAICAAVPEAVAVYGEQDIEIRERTVLDFSDGKIKYLATKPELSGSGCNFQRHCADEIFVGIDYRFNDFIQAIHRIYRFQQSNEVTVHIIYADSEEEIKQVLLDKWRRHDELTEKMSQIIREYGLTQNSVYSTLRRSIGCVRQETQGEYFTAVNNDSTEELTRMKDNSVGLVHTSIPFSNHYEYSPSYNDFGHNTDNEAFFRQMDYLTPEVYRVLMPGRVAAIHVKDRILFGNVTGTGMPTVDPFHMLTTFHFLKHGFQFMGMITIETDVVRENYQTYRLGWSEQCKDGSKMGVGCPEYLLLFRKLPTDTSTGYADFPVARSKDDYSRGRWQIDARGKWNSSGNRFLTPEELRTAGIKDASAIFHERAETMIYDYYGHVEAAEAMDNRGQLPKKFETFRVPARSPWVWDDILRMKTLNGEQAKKNLEKHICPLQIDIVERVINRWSNPGEVVLDYFGGLMTVPYCAVKMGRYGIGIELNHDYYMNGVDYLSRAEADRNAPTLFDLIETGVTTESQ